MSASFCPLPAECIKVAVRVRPQLPGEENADMCISVDEGRGAVFHEKGNRTDSRGRKTVEEASAEQYTFDSVWGKSASQPDIFTEVLPLVDSAFEGYNATVFCHGPSGSGKTHTMVGSAEQPGIVPQALARIFDLAEKQENRMLVVVLSVLELYNDQFYDILDSSMTSKEAAARKTRQASTGGFAREGIFSPPKAAKIEVVRQGKQSTIKGAYTRLQVDAAKDAMAEIESALSKRSTAGTGMNDRSSRSHAIIMVQVQQADGTTARDRENLLKSPRRRTTDVPFTTTVGTLYLVDLAGSERLKLSGVTGDGQKEAQHINKSLSALGNVLTALSKAQREGVVIPYRDSKLTLLLQDALGGNSRTMMITCISALSSVGQHTAIALQYAQRAKTIQNTATKQLDTDKTSEIEGLKKEVEELRRRLAERQATALSATADTGMVEEAVEKARQYDRLRGVMQENEKEKRELQSKLEKVINGRFMSEEDDYTMLTADLESNLARLARAYQENEDFKREILELKRKVETDGDELETTRRRSVALLQERQSLEDRNIALERRVMELEERQAAAALEREAAETLRQQGEERKVALPLERKAAEARRQEREELEEAAAFKQGEEDTGKAARAEEEELASSVAHALADRPRQVEMQEEASEEEREEEVQGAGGHHEAGEGLTTVEEEASSPPRTRQSMVPDWGLFSPFDRLAQEVLLETLGSKGAQTEALFAPATPVAVGTPKGQAAFLKSPHMLHLASPVGTPMQTTEQPSSPGELMVMCLDTGEELPVKVVLNGVSAVPLERARSDGLILEAGIKRAAESSADDASSSSSASNKVQKLSGGQKTIQPRGQNGHNEERNALASIATKINVLRCTVQRASRSLNPFQH